MVHAGCVFVAGIHPSRTWMLGSFEFVWCNACVHRIDLGLYSHPKEFLEYEISTPVNSKGKIPSTGGSEEGETHDAASSRTVSPTHYQLNASDPNTSDLEIGIFMAALQMPGILGSAVGLIGLTLVACD